MSGGSVSQFPLRKLWRWAGGGRGVNCGAGRGGGGKLWCWAGGVLQGKLRIHEHKAYSSTGIRWIYHCVLSFTENSYTFPKAPCFTGLCGCLLLVLDNMILTEWKYTAYSSKHSHIRRRLTAVFNGNCSIPRVGCSVLFSFSFFLFFSFFFFQSHRISLNYLLVNLAVADILYAVFIAPKVLVKLTVSHPDGLTGIFLCKLVTGGNLAWVGSASSIVTLVAISVERYYSVMYLFNKKGKLTRRRLKVC